MEVFDTLSYFKFSDLSLLITDFLSIFDIFCDYFDTAEKFGELS